MRLILIIFLLISCSNKNLNKVDSKDFININYQIESIYNQNDINSRMIIDFTSLITTNQLGFNLYSNAYKNPIYYPKLGQVFKSGGIAIIQVSNNQKMLDFNYSKSQQMLYVNLNETILYLQEYQIVIDFITTIPESNSRFGCYKGICSITSWYPLLAKYNSLSKTWHSYDYSIHGESDYLNCANYQVKIQTPIIEQLISNGVSKEVIILKDSKIFQIEGENIRNFVFFTGQDLTTKQLQFDEYTILLTYQQTDHSQFLLIKENLFENIKKAIRYLNQTIGPFIYQELDIIATRIEGFAMEYSSLIHMGRLFNYDDFSLLFHEITHQYFHAAIGSNSYLEPFIDEGFTSYITALYFSNLNKVKEEFLTIHQYYLGKMSNSMSYFDRGDGSNYYVHVYMGSVVLLYNFDLKYSGLDRIIKLIYQEYKFKIFTINDLLDLIKISHNFRISKEFEKGLKRVYYQF